MKHVTRILLILPPILLLVLLAVGRTASALEVHFDSHLWFLILDAFWILSSLACLIRGVLLLKSQERLGWICIALSVFYLLVLAMIQPAHT